MDPVSSGASQPVLDEPYYFVLVAIPDVGKPYFPTVAAPEFIASYRAGRITLPLGFDRRFVAILPILTYILQLPRTRFDLVKNPIKGSKQAQRLHLPHRVVLIPTPTPQPLMDHLRENGLPKLVFAEDTLLSAARDLANQVSGVLDVACNSMLTDELLQAQWRSLHAALRVERPLHSPPSKLIVETSSCAALLSMLSSARKLSPIWERDAPSPVTAQDTFTGHSLEIQAQLDAIARLEVERTPRAEAERIFPEALEEARETFRCPVTVGVPGISSRAPTRITQKLLAHAAVPSPDDSAIEQRALDLAVAHRALASSGIGFMAGSVPDEAFHLLHRLEQLWETGPPRSKPVWSLLDQIGGLLPTIFTDVQSAGLTHALPLTCFSEFPIGLLRVPGDTSPLCCRIPIVYRPMLPLTRSLQLELTGVPTLHLRGRLNVLVAECIPATDLVGRLSRVAWRIGKDRLTRTPNARMRIADVGSLAELRSLLDEDSYHVLVLSAHGQVQDNKAGVLVGDELVVEQDLGTLPPIVCLSACKVAPRGEGTVNVTDLMLRQGAAAVIGTLVPIDVRRNATLMARFFGRLSEALEGNAPAKSLDGLWHWVQMSNAVNDVVSGNKAMQQWAHAGSYEDTVIAEFMLRRSPGRLRGGHIYADTELLLQEIARTRGIEDRFKSWLRNPGYVPESLFYVVLGAADRLVFFDAEWANTEDRFRQIDVKDVRC